MKFTVESIKEQMLENIQQMSEAAKSIGNETEAHELHLFASNDGELYHSMGKHIITNLQKKHDKGRYVHSSDDNHNAVQAWGNLMDVASKKYQKHFGSGVGHAFSKGTRMMAAKMMADEKQEEHGWGKQNEEVEIEENELQEATFTRKHFKMIADTVSKIEDEKVRQQMANSHAEAFKASNPRFDASKFHAACGTKCGE